MSFERKALSQSPAKSPFWAPQLNQYRHLPGRGSTARIHRALPGYFLMKEAPAALSSSQGIPRAALLREHPGVAELEQEKGLGMRGILLPCPPLLFPDFSLSCSHVPFVKKCQTVHKTCPPGLYQWA